MKKALFIILAFPLFVFSQKVTYTGIILVDSIPEELLYPGADEMGFITAGDNNQPVGFGYEMSELNYKIVAKLGNEFSDYKGVDAKAFYKNDTLFFHSHVKYKDVQTWCYYSWDSKKLSLMETVTIDPSSEATREGEAALRKGNIREAAEHYNKVKYVSPSTLAKTAFNLLGVAHIHAKDKFNSNDLKGAVEDMDGAFVYHLNDSLLKSPDEFAYNKIVMGNFEPRQADSLGPWLSNYALFLYKADSLERALKQAQFVIMCYPKMADTYLTLADVLYDLKREEESMPIYDKYILLMTARGDESLVPLRAKERKEPKKDPKKKNEQD